MPNPYHDANGKFCSRNGMLSSIQELVGNGNVDQAMTLMAEFKQIEQQKSAPKPDPEEVKIPWDKSNALPTFYAYLRQEGITVTPEDEKHFKGAFSSLYADGYSKGQEYAEKKDAAPDIDAEAIADNIIKTLPSKGKKYTKRIRKIFANGIEAFHGKAIYEGEMDAW